MKWPYYPKDKNQITLNYTTLQNLRGLCSNFFECESFLESNSPNNSCSLWDILGWLNWFWQFFCEGLSSFGLEGFCYSYGCCCNFCEGRSSFCTGLIFRKLCGFLFMFLTGFTSFSVVLLLSLVITFFVFMHGFWCFSSNTDEVLLINLSANVFVGVSSWWLANLSWWNW